MTWLLFCCSSSVLSTLFLAAVIHKFPHGGINKVLFDLILWNYDDGDDMLTFPSSINAYRLAVWTTASILEWPQYCFSLKCCLRLFVIQTRHDSWLFYNKSVQTGRCQKCFRLPYQFFIDHAAPVDAGPSFSATLVVDLVTFVPQLHHSVT